MMAAALPAASRSSPSVRPFFAEAAASWTVVRSRSTAREAASAPRREPPPIASSSRDEEEGEEVRDHARANVVNANARQS